MCTCFSPDQDEAKAAEAEGKPAKVQASEAVPMEVDGVGSGTPAKASNSAASSTGSPPPSKGQCQKKAKPVLDAAMVEAKRQEHNAWMRMSRSLRSGNDVPDEVIRCAFVDNTVKSRGRRTMRCLFEVFMAANGDWHRSSLVFAYRQTSSSKKVGTFVWVTYAEIQKEYLDHDISGDCFRFFLYMYSVDFARNFTYSIIYHVVFIL